MNRMVSKLLNWWSFETFIIFFIGAILSANIQYLVVDHKLLVTTARH